MSRKLTQAELLAAVQRLEYLRRVEDFDARNAGSRMTSEQLEAFNCIASYAVKNVFVMGGNQSGKSQLLRRLIAWFLAEPPEAPWKRRPEWQGPLQGILICKSHKILEGSIVEGIRPFFEGDPNFHVISNGHAIVKLEYKANGNHIYCLVHENTKQCRERVQSFTSHMAFLDELPSGPDAYKLMEETAARIIKHKGVFSSFYTPKSINPQIKKWVETMPYPAGKKFTLSFINNPGIDQEAKKQRLAEIKALPKHMQETVLTGAWLNAENSVFTLPDEAIQFPDNYSPLWRHVVCVDPGLASAQGVVTLAEEPTTGNWYIVWAEKMDKITDVDEAVDRVWKLIAQNYWNVARIVYDPAGTYWYMQAKKHENMGKYKITCPYDKNNTERKMEMISNLQVALGTKLFVYPNQEDLLDEFANCEWSDTAEGKIKKGQKFHLLDALRYGWDCIPKWEGKPTPLETDPQRQFAQRVRAGHEEYERREAQSRRGGWRSSGIIGGFRITNRR